MIDGSLAHFIMGEMRIMWDGCQRLTSLATFARVEMDDCRVRMETLRWTSTA